MENIVQLSRIFGVSTDYLLTDDGVMVMSKSENTITDGAASGYNILRDSIRSRHHKAILIFGVAFTFLGLVGILTIWIADRMSLWLDYESLVVSFVNSSRGLFFFCCVVAVVGLIIVFYPFLKSFFTSDEKIDKEIEKMKDELVADVIGQEMEGIRNSLRSSKK